MIPQRKGVSVDAPQRRVKYKPQGPVMAEFHNQDAFVRGVIGPLGSSKTFGAINEILRLCHTQVPDRNNVRRSRWCIARNSFPDLNAATIPDVRSIVDHLNPNGWNMTAPITWKHRYRRADGTRVQIELMFRSFDGPQDVKKARGMQLTGAWVDEAGEFNKENLDMLIGRVKRYPAKVEVPKAEFDVLFTSNAVAQDHWLAELARRPPPNWWIGIQPPAVFKVGGLWVENPEAENFKNLPPNYYLDQCGGKKESWIRQNLANEFVLHSDGRAVHPDFSQSIHVGPCSYIPGLPLYLGFDFGRTPAAVILQRKPNGAWRALKEVVCKNMGADKFGRVLKLELNENYQGAEIAEATGDPSGGSGTQSSDDTAFELLEANSGVFALPAYTNDPEIRYATLDQLLVKLIDGEPAFLVDPEGCPTLVRGLAGEFQFRRLQVVGQERFQDKADKGPTSHVCEALHYALMGAGEAEALFDQSGADGYDDVESWAQPDFVYE